MPETADEQPILGSRRTSCWVIRSRDELVDLLTRIEVRVLATGPAAGLVNAESFADALLGELPRTELWVRDA